MAANRVREIVFTVRVWLTAFNEYLLEGLMLI